MSEEHENHTFTFKPDVNSNIKACIRFESSDMSLPKYVELCLSGAAWNIPIKDMAAILHWLKSKGWA